VLDGLQCHLFIFTRIADHWLACSIGLIQYVANFDRVEPDRGSTGTAGWLRQNTQHATAVNDR
jgi:hypothetical protein